MKHVKLFEEWTPQTANLQKVRISTTDSNGMISMIGHLVQEYDNYFFIPEEGGFEWIEKRHTPPYLMRIEKTFNENIGKKLPITGNQSVILTLKYSNSGTNITNASISVKNEASKPTKDSNGFATQSDLVIGTLQVIENIPNFTNNITSFIIKSSCGLSPLEYYYA